MTVTLTTTEWMRAGYVGLQRHIASKRQGLQDKHGADKEKGFDLHIIGACGELAAAKAIGRYWPGGINTFKSPDIGTNVQVRYRSVDWYDLIVRSDDPPDHLYVLVTGKDDAYEVRGWAYGWEGPKLGDWKDYGNREFSWFIPQGRLRTMDTFPQESK